MRERFHIRGYPILECSRCLGFSLGAADGTATPSTEADYSDSYLCRGAGATKLTGYFDYEGDLQIHLKNFQQYVGLIRRHSHGLALLDVGCASGHFLEAASRAGFMAKGIDVAGASTALAQSRGFQVWTGDPATIDLAERFDVITLWETIEHVPNPDALLGQIRSWLKPGGIIVIGTGNNRSLLSRLLGRRWWYLVPPDHCVVYNPRALTIVLERNGFHVERTYRIWAHLVSSRNAIMKLLRSFQVKPAWALKVARALPELPLTIVHRTTMVLVARSV